MGTEAMRLAPVRLCCFQRHLGPECPDGTFMCAACFEKFAVTDAWQDGEGQRWDLCRECGER